MHYPKVWTLNHRRQRAWIFPCWFQPSSLVTCPTLYTYLMPLWLRGPLSHFVAEIIRSGAMENSAWALRLLTGECSICSYQYNSLPSELPLLQSTTNQYRKITILLCKNQRTFCHGFQFAHCCLNCPLVNIQKTIENGHRNSEFSH